MLNDVSINAALTASFMTANKAFLSSCKLNSIYYNSLRDRGVAPACPKRAA